MLQGSFPKSSSQQEDDETVRLSDKTTIPPISDSGDKDTESDKLVGDLLRRVAQDVSFRRRGKFMGDDSPDSHRKTLTRDEAESNDENTRHHGQRRRHRHQGNSPYEYNSRLRHESCMEIRSTRYREVKDESSRSQKRRPIDVRASHPDDVPAAVDRVAAALTNGQPRIAGDGRPHAKAATSAPSITDHGADPFTEVMWEDSSCRQVLQAMFFGPHSAIPAGHSEEYKELEEFVPKFLARRAQAAKASASKRPTKKTSASTQGTPLESSGDRVHIERPEVGSTSRPLLPTISALPSTFHKRHLTNFAGLSPEQQRAAQELERLAHRNRFAGWKGWANPPGSDRDEATLRELSRQGVLKREEVKAMLRTGPMQDFHRNVLQAYMDFRMRKSLAKVIKIRSDRAALPIAAYQDAIVKAVASNPCVLVAGDTGCGKSTQVPQFLLQAGYGRVACTQPRRISAIGLCRRVSYETLNEHGSEVAYQVRFESSRRKSSRILFLTEGLLLRQITSDPDLSAYSVIIVDEVHERHASGDFLLGLLRAVLKRRVDLKVVLMSATINPELFSRFFDGAPLIRVPGRMHPVEVRYVPTAADDGIHEAVSKHDGEGQRKLRTRRAGSEGKRVVLDVRPYVKLLETIDAITPRDERGDLLVFLSGMSDMLAVSEGVREFVEGYNPRRWVVLMLHSSLSIEEQDKVFDAAPLGTRKMILATNIAETSVTIDGIRFVADSGKAKEMSWDPTSGVRSLQEFWVSRASAEQRKGRAGRTGPGVCFRLYTRDTFDRLSPFAEPEIRRCPLEGLVLQMKSLGLTDPRRFPYLSPPPPENLMAALEALALLGATNAAKDINDGGPIARPEERSLEPSRQTGIGEGDGGMVFADAIARAPLTPLGRVLSSLPVEPSIGKMLALASLFGEIEHVLTLAAALSTQTPFDARSAGSSASSGVNPVAEFVSPDGDPFTVMNAYDEWIRVKADRHESSRRWCKRHGLQEQRLYEITKLRRQFQDLLADSGLLWLGAAAERARKRGLARRGATAVSKDKLHELKMRRDGRKRKVLQVEVGVDVSGGGRGEDALVGVKAETEEKSKAEAEEAERDLRGEMGEGVTDTGDDGIDLSSLEFYMAQNVDQLAESSRRRLTRRDVSVIKAILCQGLYPNFAVADAGNTGRPSNERQYVTRPSGGLFMSPSSVLACQDFGRRADDRRGSATSNMASSGSVTQAGRGDGLLCYGSVVETQRPFLSSVTPLPALQALLLFSARIDTSEDASLMLFDHWLLVEMRGKDPALVGQKLLAVTCGLRARLKALLSGALAEAERRRRTSMTISAGSEGKLKTMSKVRLDDGPEDLPPLLIMAREAWLDGERLSGDDESESGGKRVAEQMQTVDWAQKAEDLSVELADFMLQPIGYDVRSISPRQVEALIVDNVRLSEPAELRRVLRGARGSKEWIADSAKGAAEVRDSSCAGGKNSVDGEDIPELLAALSRAVDEEVRGTRGLFGLNSGVLERLKSGVRLTPFLTHGSIRHRDPDKAASGSLAAGGLKKWWRCPRCSLSQVVDLEAIHEHFKVCLVDPGSNATGREKGQLKRPRLLGTSVKTGRPHSLPKERTRRKDDV